MYAYLTGKIIEKTPAYVVLDVNDVGYFIHISLNTYEAIANQEKVRLFVHQSIREDVHLLFGFAEEAERSLFLQLISVSGVGAATARLILSSLTSSEAIEAIATGNVALLQRVKGIGAKTAQRIIVDLRDKVGKLVEEGIEKTSISYNTSKEEALSALLVLGFNKATAEKTLTKLLQQDPSLTVEKLIKEALKLL